MNTLESSVTEAPRLTNIFWRPSSMEMSAGARGARARWTENNAINDLRENRVI
jgi:hypothetical protein